MNLLDNVRLSRGPNRYRLNPWQSPLLFTEEYKSMKHSEAFVRLVDDAKTRVKEIEPEEVLKKLNAGEHFHFVDVREDNEWDKSRARGSRHLGRGIIERDIEKDIPKDELVVLYCGGGFRSALAADNIQKMGYTNVLSMAGGMRLWREKGYPEEN